MDPLLATSAPPGSQASKMSLTSAWESRGAPMVAFGKNLTDISYKDSSLVFFRNLTTGRDKGQVPAAVRTFNTLPVPQSML